MNIWAFLKVGGFTMYILIACSVLSLAIIMERLVHYRVRSRVKRKAFMSSIAELIRRSDVVNAKELCKRSDTPISNVVGAGLELIGHDEVVLSNAMERQVTIETARLERFTSIIGTIGSTAVYIGLFGTVMGIIRAFQDIAKAGSGGVSVVISGISEALVCTAAGLCVAVPAVIAYNYFVKKVDGFIMDMELCASELMDLIAGKHR